MSHILTTGALAALVLFTGSAANALTYNEPPDLTSNLAIPDPLGTLSAGTNTISGAISANGTGMTSAFDSDDGDSFEFSIPAGFVANQFRLEITSYSRSGDVSSRHRSFSDGLDTNRFSGDTVFTNVIDAPSGCLQAGQHDFQVTGFYSGIDDAQWSIDYSWTATVTLSEGDCQTITFSNPGSQTAGDDLTVTATASSGLAVSFSSETPAVCSVTSNGSVTLLSAGDCTISADQSGNGTFAAAAQQQQTFSVSQPAATVPAAPTALTATPGEGEASVSFTPGADNGSAITNYEYSVNDGATFTAFSPAVTASPVIITGLTNGTNYQVQLRAVNAVGSGATSASVSVTPEAPDADNDGIADDEDPYPNADTNEQISGSGVSLTTMPSRADSSCSIATLESAAISESEPGIATNGIGQAISFTLIGCDTSSAETIDVIIDLGNAPPADSAVYKILGNGDWQQIDGASISGRLLTYTLVDNGPLDQDFVLGTIEDPVTVAVPLAATGRPATPVPALPLWGFITLAGLLGLIGYRKTN